MTREMPKIKRTRKLVITERQAAGSREGQDIVAHESNEEDVDSKLIKQIELSKQRMAMKYKKSTVDSKQVTSSHSTPLKSLDNVMLEDKLQRRRRTPCKDLLEPTIGRSTPINNDTSKDDPFGFDVLDSPLVFSPVLPSNITASSSSQLDTSDANAASNDVTVKRRSFGTYDIPIKAKPIVNVKKKKQKNNQPLSAMEEWAQQLNAEFDEVDNFQLMID